MQILLPERSQTPLNDDQYHLLQQFFSTLSPEQAAWVGGYVTGRVAKDLPSLPSAADIADITILVGSQTGNGEVLAEQLHSLAAGRGLKTVIKKMGDYKLPQLKAEKNLLVIVSTYGEGEPPDNAKELVEYLFSKRAPTLKQMHFAVLGLGDSGYEFFCKTGIDFDHRLEELGATRIHPRVDCDVDYESSAEAWMDAVLNALSIRLEANSQTAEPASPSVASTSVYSRKYPFPALLLENIVLNGWGSLKETHHLEFSLEGSGLTYEPGDVLGVYPANAPDVIDALLQTLHFAGTEWVTLDGNKEGFLYDALFRHYEITAITRPVMQKYALLAHNQKLDQLLQNKQKLNDYLYGREMIDLIIDFPIG
ncbi:MAG: flavodoxin domain-containing protein, partial [Methylobacter sp.]